MTVQTLLNTISARELRHWMILWRVRAVERELAALKRKSQKG